MARGAGGGTSQVARKNELTLVQCCFDVSDIEPTVTRWYTIDGIEDLKQRLSSVHVSACAAEEIILRDVSEKEHYLNLYFIHATTI